MEKYFSGKFLTGIKSEENQELSFLDVVVKTTEWRLTMSHGIMEVNLTQQTASNFKEAAVKLKQLEIIGLSSTSELDAALENLPLINELKIITVIPECEAFSWNEMKVLALANAMKSQIQKSFALSLSAALWVPGIPDSQGAKCEWTDRTPGILTCMKEGRAFDQCRFEGMVMVDNRTIFALVNYARSKNINTFCIRSAQNILDTLFLNRPFRLLNFTLSPVPAKNRLAPSMPLRELGLDDSQSSGSGLPASGATSIKVSDADPEGSGMSLEAAEYHGMSGVAKMSSSDAKSAKRIKNPRRGSMASSVPSIPAIHETENWPAPTSATPVSTASCDPAEGCTQT
ncbi:uncharacterized protein LOC125940951 [Dermacentor silvarum]|uniref:uncharacterized protein LOC125940951 n=1 Tax=Dermacentor silvarum TaxID=543639 RepID=UPI002101B3CD|nr:uncharacterized protein LOC125940951 [Dermacentor silvarum]